jgi:hypothetical protein
MSVSNISEISRLGDLEAYPAIKTPKRRWVPPHIILPTLIECLTSKTQYFAENPYTNTYPGPS